MAHTNETTNYNLPQFLGSDKPAWLTDINQAFAAIDAGMGANRTSAQQAASAAAAAQTSADTANSAATAASSAASAAQLTANQAAADILGVQSRVQALESAGYLTSETQDVDGWKVYRTSDGVKKAFKTINFGTVSGSQAAGFNAIVENIAIPSGMFSEVFGANCQLTWGTGFYFAGIRSVTRTNVSVNCFTTATGTLEVSVEITGKE